MDSGTDFSPRELNDSLPSDPQDSFKKHSRLVQGMARMPPAESIQEK